MKKSKERKELEADIAAFDKTWKGKMDRMDLDTLLSKVHPSYRVQHARKLRATGELSKRVHDKYVSRNVSFMDEI